jgi:hypothetical protein
VDPVSDPLLLRKSCSAGNRTRDLYCNYISLQHLVVTTGTIQFTPVYKLFVYKMNWEEVLCIIRPHISSLKSLIRGHGATSQKRHSGYRMSEKYVPEI